MMMDSDRLKRALRGVNVNALHKNLLHLAITKNTPECAKELILNHCNLEARDENGFTPLHTAVLEGQEWAVELLYNNGAILDALVLCSRPCDDCHLSCFNGMMPVHLAVNTRTAAVSMMKFLLGLKRGKRVTVNKPAHDEDRHTALHYAARHGNLEMIELLLKSGAKVSDLGGKDGESPLHTAAWWNMVAATKLLIDKGADINLADNNGCTPLHIAAGRGNILVVNLLYEEGADHKATDGSGRTVLHHAASWGHVGLVELCLDNGADINAVSKTNGWTALHIAARECHAKTVELLRCRGADSSLRYIGASTDTRLEVAMRKGHTRAHLLEDIPFSCP